MPEFKANEAEREAKKSQELAPYIAAALARKERMPALADADIPIFEALGRRDHRRKRVGQDESIYDEPSAG